MMLLRLPSTRLKASSPPWQLLSVERGAVVTGLVPTDEGGLHGLVKVREQPAG